MSSTSPTPKGKTPKRQTVAELRAAVDAAEARADRWQQSIFGHIERNTHLEAALRRWGHHDPGCPGGPIGVGGGAEPCPCGFGTFFANGGHLDEQG